MLEYEFFPVVNPLRTQRRGVRYASPYYPVHVPEPPFADPSSVYSTPASEYWTSREPFIRVMPPKRIRTVRWDDTKSRLDLVRSYLLENATYLARVPMRRLVPVCLYIEDENVHIGQINKVLHQLFELFNLEPVIQLQPMFGSFLGRIIGVTDEEETAEGLRALLLRGAEKLKPEKERVDPKLLWSKELRKWVLLIGSMVFAGLHPGALPGSSEAGKAPAITQEFVIREVPQDALTRDLPRILLDNDLTTAGEQMTKTASDPTNVSIWQNPLPK